MASYPHIRRLFDLVILAAIAASLVYLVPKLLGLASETVATHAGELSPLEQVETHRGIFLVGMLVLIGGIALIIPCHSWFAAPTQPPRRVLLGLACMMPLATALLGFVLGPDHMQPAFTRLGFICSLGGWAFALPVVLGNQSLVDVIAGMRSPAPKPRGSRKSKVERHKSRSSNRPST